MSKAFTREETAQDEDDQEAGEASLPVERNYMTPAGHARMLAELNQLLRVERPALVDVVAWAASNGDRSENGDYLYGKKRLREIDRRIRYLSKRLEHAVVVDPRDRAGCEQVYFGATVTIVDEQDQSQRLSIVGIDEADPKRGRISWISPLARALFKAEVGDEVRLDTPGGRRTFTIAQIEYLPLD